jgi:heme exporter protein A
MLEWRELGKQFGRRRLFSGLSGALADGVPLVVTGRNGSGKSTFLRILAGLVRPDYGSVIRTTTRVGYASPDLSLYGELTGLENLEFFASVRPGASLDARELLERAGIAKAANRPVGQYSSGMRQRLKIAVAIAHQPDILFLDEPTLALDSDGVAFVESVVADYSQAGKCLAIATNDAGESARWAAARLDLG